MNYEQKYKEALDNAKVVYKTIRKDLKPVIEQIFPELKESDDEGIRESIIGFLTMISSLRDGKTLCNEDFDSKVILEWVAWLEKQREPKDYSSIDPHFGKSVDKVEPISSWNEEDEKILRDATGAVSIAYCLARKARF